MQRAGGNAKMLREKEKVLPSEVLTTMACGSGREVIHTVQVDQAHDLKPKADIYISLKMFSKLVSWPLS